MRVGTWNCQSGLDANWAILEELAADVLVVQECSSNTPEQAEANGWTCAWQPGGYKRGLAVLARHPYAIEERENPDDFVVSTLISGPNRFRFVGFWALSEKVAGYSYPRQATRLIERLPDDGVPTVVAGDFNASKSEQHLANVKLLRGLGLVSAYHTHHRLDHAAVEQHPTLYFQWKESRRYHMDFVFVPTAWAIKSVEVGSFADYPGRRLSDHTPIVVTLDPD